MRLLKRVGVVCCCVCLIYGFQKAAWPPPVQKVPPESPALPVDEAMKKFFMPPGYRLDVVAAEPLVQDPVAMDIDADGRLFVVEMPGFAADESMRDSLEPIGRVVVLEDTNNDGRMDKRTVFLDKLVLPRAVKTLANGVLVGEPPNLWFARDTDGDLKADAKELVRNDFGRAEGNLEHNANGLYWGMDNIIYIAEHEYNIRLKNGKFEMIPALSRGQWGITQDDAGRIYRNWNEQPLFADIVPVHYFKRNPNMVRTRGLYEVLIERNETAIWPVRPTRGLQRAYREGMLRPDGTATTYASSADPVIFRGDRLPKELHGNAFIGESPTNIVHRLIVTDDGTGRLKARDAYAKGEFLASTDERFRPVNLYSAADGTLYVVDMYRGVVQDVAYQTEYLNTYIKEHKLQMPVGLGRIYRVVHESMKPGPRPALSKATPATLARTLSHPNGWWRDTAQQLLVQRGDKSVVPALKRLALDAPDYRTRLHAMWTLDGLDEIDPATMQKAFDDKSPDVRAAAIRISERWLGEANHPLHTAVLKKSDDANWIVRRQLTASLGALPPAARVAPLAAMLDRYGEDPIIVDAAISGLAGHEAEMLARVLESKAAQQKAGDAVTNLATTVARARNEAATTKLFEIAADGNRAMWQRVSVLRGVDLGLSATGGRGGGGGGGAGRGLGGTFPGFGRGAQATPGVSFTAEPKTLTGLAGGSGELADAAKQVTARLTWPGKPSAAPAAGRLTADEEARFTAGQQIYNNYCAGCHQADGTGKEKAATNLVTSPLVVANAQAGMRVLLNGKEGSLGLMPPLAATLKDDQIAAVLTYIRRSWGHTASPVTPEEVKETRGITSNRKTPWTDQELARFSGSGRGGRGRGN